MNKYLLLNILLCFFLQSAIYAQWNNIHELAQRHSSIVNWQSEKIRTNKIKSVTQYVQEIQKNDSLKMISYLFFDTSGYLIQEYEQINDSKSRKFAYNTNGLISSVNEDSVDVFTFDYEDSITYEYHNGKLLFCEQYDLQDKQYKHNTVISNAIILDINDGVRKRSIRSKSEKPFFLSREFIYTVDSADRLIKKMVVDDNHIDKIYEYDTLGNIISLLQFWYDSYHNRDTELSFDTYEYKDGLLVTYISHLIVSERYEIDCDSNGVIKNRTKQRIYGKSDTTYFAYDKGVLKQKLSKQQIVKYEYNDKKLLIKEEKLYNNELNVYIYEYEYYK